MFNSLYTVGSVLGDSWFPQASRCQSGLRDIGLRFSRFCSDVHGSSEVHGGMFRPGSGRVRNESRVVGWNDQDPEESETTGKWLLGFHREAKGLG